jgi:hypothetical protein
MPHLLNLASLYHVKNCKISKSGCSGALTRWRPGQPQTASGKSRKGIIGTLRRDLRS